MQLQFSVSLQPSVTRDKAINSETVRDTWSLYVCPHIQQLVAFPQILGVCTLLLERVRTPVQW